jgi:hypothetical protein
MQSRFKVLLALAFAVGMIGAGAAWSQINTIRNGGFENAEAPAYWHKANAGGATLEWASDVVRSPQRSLKISKSSGSEAPAWESDNLAKLNWNPTTGIPANIEMEIGGWVKTENVNTNPANDAAKIQLRFKFFDAAHNLIFGQPVVLEVPQTQSSIDWTEIKNSAAVVLPVDADSMAIEFQMGRMPAARFISTTCSCAMRPAHKVGWAICSTPTSAYPKAGSFGKAS